MAKFNLNVQNFTVKAEITDLENLDWDFINEAEQRATALGLYIITALEQIRNNFYVEIEVNEGSTLYCIREYNNNQSIDKTETGDDSKTLKDLEILNEKNLLFEFEEL